MMALRAFAFAAALTSAVAEDPGREVAVSIQYTGLRVVCSGIPNLQQQNALNPQSPVTYTLNWP